eukprot:5850023-Pleurochrysis_carterae.AAC.1
MKSSEASCVGSASEKYSMRRMVVEGLSVVMLTKIGDTTGMSGTSSTYTYTGCAGAVRVSSKRQSVAEYEKPSIPKTSGNGW